MEEMKMQKSLSLNPQQLQAIDHHMGPCIVYAGPGSGKTTVIVQRVLRLIKIYAVPPEQILVVTFTKAAAEEMKERFQQAYSGKKGGGSDVTFGTLHSLFYRILRKNLSDDLGKLLNESGRIKIIKGLLKELELDRGADSEYIGRLILEMGLYYSDLKHREEFKPQLLEKEQFLALIQAYEEIKIQHRLFDFDDMLEKTYWLLRKQPVLLESLQHQFQYILVDEFQDINGLQFELIQLLSQSRNNLFVVGDDDQSIYSFRGGKPELILDFDRYYPQAKRIYLQQNYRSQEPIVAAANRLVTQNQIRIQKQMIAQQKGDRPIRYLKPKDRAEENALVCRLITEAYHQGIPCSEMAVIFRTNHVTASLAKEFIAHSIPFYCKEKIPNLFEHWVVQDILAYLHCSQPLKGELGKEALRVIANKPLRYLPKNWMELALRTEDPLGYLMNYSEIQPYQREKLDKLQLDLKVIQKMKPYYAIRYIRSHIGYDGYLEGYCLDKKLASQGLLEILDELEAFTENLPNYHSLIDQVRSFGEVLLWANQGGSRETGVNLLTMHGAKGLEFQWVIVIGAIEGTMPHRRSKHAAESIEEERRLFYVAITRAKKILYISSPEGNQDRKMPISRFVEEMST